MNLHKLLADICRIAGLNKAPKLTECKGMVAQTRFNRIRIGRKLCSGLTENEMKGVIAHEVYHARNLSKTLASCIIVPVAFIAITSAIYLALAYKSQVFLSFLPPHPFLLILSISALLVSILWSGHRSGRSEIGADRFATSVVGPKSFDKTLRKLENMQFEHWPLSRLKEWLCPHPPLSKRLEAIRNVKRLPRPARQPTSIEEKTRAK